MQHEPWADSPITWVTYAKADLVLASIPLPAGVMYSLLCFHAQQAVEKALKSILIHFGVEFPNTHSIQKLIELLPSELRTNEAICQSVILTPYAVQTRYPGDLEEVQQDEYSDAVRIASDVVHLAEEIVT